MSQKPNALRPTHDSPAGALIGTGESALQQIAESPYLTEDQKRALSGKAVEMGMELQREQAAGHVASERFERDLHTGLAASHEKQRQFRDAVSDMKALGASGTGRYRFAISSGRDPEFEASIETTKSVSVRERLLGS